MEKKLTSIRLDSDTLDKIEKLAAVHTYWKRSDIINNVLRAVFENFDDGAIYDMIRVYAWRKNVVKCDFEITNDLKPYEKK